VAVFSSARSVSELEVDDGMISARFGYNLNP
jgi:hypothetical protein